MIEDCDLKVQGAGYGLILANSQKIFAERLCKPQVAVCPNCGEISMYIDDTSKLKR